MIGNFKVSEPYSESKNSFFIELAAKLGPPKEFKPITREEMLAMQPKSTQRLMLMTDEEHTAFHESLISTEGQTTLADMSLSPQEMSAKVGTRPITIEETINYDAHRKASKNTQHQFTEGHGNLISPSHSSVTEESKRRAVDALIFSPPAPAETIDPNRIIGLKEIASEAPSQEEKPKKIIGTNWLNDWLYRREKKRIEKGLAEDRREWGIK